MKFSHIIICIIGAALMLLAGAVPSRAQSKDLPMRHMSPTEIGEDTLFVDSLASDSALSASLVKADSASIAAIDTSKHKRDWASWRPSAKRALWLALVLPGAGQIYNRKYWKLPIFYGGFVGCIYAMRWNNMMYRDYSQAYLDLLDADMSTQSYNQFLHLGARIDESKEADVSRWGEVFRKRKDRYRRWRDMSFFVMVAVYGLSVVDAYVDASLSEFDISPDLSIHISPAVIHDNSLSYRPFSSAGIGLNCSIIF